MKIHFFNPENDLALADGNSNYCPPPAARAIAHDLASLPLWYAMPGDSVILPDALHRSYRSKMAELFDIAPEYAGGEGVCSPWGWSRQVRSRLAAMGFGDAALLPIKRVEQIRVLSNRRCVIDILRYLSSVGIDIPELPRYLTNPDDVACFINSMMRSVIKAPWSGSGKGIAWGLGRVETPVEHFYTGVIRRQGGVLCERCLNKRADFAMEFRAGITGVSFAGYSLFTCAGASYSGNILASDAEIESFLSGLVPLDELHAVKRALETYFSRLLAPVGYDGYFGVDMLVYCDSGNLRLHPCLEVNLRMNMGAVARIFYDRYVASGKNGTFYVPHYKNADDALHVNDYMKCAYPLKVENGRITGGYISLTPVTHASRYAAYAIIEDTPIGELYSRERE